MLSSPKRHHSPALPPAKRFAVPSQEVIDVSDDECVSGWSDDDDTQQMQVVDCVEKISTSMHLDTTNPPKRARHIQPFVNSAPLFFEAQTSHRQRNAAYLETLGTYSQAEIDGDPRFRTFRSNGDDIVKVMRLALESFNMTRTFLQICMHDMAMNVMAGVIYEHEWNEDRERILEANNWRDYPPIMAAICARRFGKTTGVAQLAAAAMISIPECPVGCFAPTLRQATAIMQTCWSMLSRSYMFNQFRVVRTRQIEIVVQGPDGTLRSLIAYPSTHKVSRDGERVSQFIPFQVR